MLKEIYKIRITDYDGKFSGVGRVENFVIFVEYALLDEVVLAEIIEIKKHYARARIVEILEKSPHRIEPFCEYFDECGGCDLQHVSYEYGLELKGKAVGVENIISAQTLKNYRNTAQYKSDGDKIGFYKRGTHEIIDIDNCPICHVDDGEVLRNSRGTAGEIIARNGKISQNETIDFRGKKFKITPQTFFQVNYEMAEKLVKKIIEFMPKKAGLVYDLYCGVGSIAISIAEFCEKVIGIEIVKDSIKMAKENAEMNGILNAEFVCGKAEDYKFIETPDCIIVDPPRQGLHKSLIDKLNKIRAKTIIYVSCNPKTFARDMELLEDYEVEFMQGIDMFPWTHHLELVAKLTLKTH